MPIYPITHINNLTRGTLDTNNGNKVTISAGSILSINLNHTPQANIAGNYKTVRAHVANGDIQQLPTGQLQVVRDISGLSPSAARVFADGQVGSGWLAWRLHDGRLIDVLRKGNIPLSNPTPATIPIPATVPAARVTRHDRAPQLLEVPPATTPPTLTGPDHNPGNLVRALVDWIQFDPYKAPGQKAITQGWDQRIKTYAYAIKGAPNAWPAVYSDTAPLIKGLQAIVRAYNWNTVSGPSSLSPSDNQAILDLANRVRVWGGVRKPKNFMDAWNVIKTAVLDTRNSQAPMNSGWTKIASFASDGLPNAQTIWDSRVSTSVIWRFDKILHSNLLTPQSILGHYKLGLVKGRSNPTGPRGRHYQFLGGWPWGNGKWICHLDGGKLVRDMVATLNNHALNYPRMPLPNGGSGDWDVFGVGLVLFMDGY